MLKTLFLSVLLFITSVLIFNPLLGVPLPQALALIAPTPVVVAQAAQPSPQDTQPEPENANPLSNDDNRAKQPETEESSARTTADRQPTESAGPYDMEAIKAFNRALYGS